MLREILFTKKGAPADELFTRLFLRAPVMERELTGALPLSFKSDGTSLLDWRISGSAGGVGKLGKNYLKQTEKVNVDNGAIGIKIGDPSDWLSANEVITVNSGEATRLFVTFRRGENAAISPEDVGQFVLTEASESENLYKGVLRNGGAMVYETGNVTSTSKNPYILLPVGDNGDGRIFYYGDKENTISTRVRTESIKVKPNTDYRIFTVGAAGDVTLSYRFLDEPGYIRNQYMSPYYTKSIPGNKTMDKLVEQWCDLDYTHYRRVEYQPQIPIDCRPMLYDYCESFADLKAGTYKFIVEIWANNHFTGVGYVGGCQSPSNYIETYWDANDIIDKEWFALIAEDNSLIIPRTRLYQSDDNRTKSGNEDPPYPTFFHYEYEFTINQDTKVGLIHKAYYKSVSTAEPAYYRFMIVDPDVEAEPFETTVSSGTNQSGVTSWEPYHCVLPITVSCGEQSQVITVDLGDSLLGEGESISLADTSINIPTYIGRNTISIETNNDAPAEMYIRYMG